MPHSSHEDVEALVGRVYELKLVQVKVIVRAGLAVMTGSVDMGKVDMGRAEAIECI